MLGIGGSSRFYKHLIIGSFGNERFVDLKIPSFDVVSLERLKGTNCAVPCSADYVVLFLSPAPQGNCTFDIVQGVLVMEYS